MADTCWYIVTDLTSLSSKVGEGGNSAGLPNQHGVVRLLQTGVKKTCRCGYNWEKTLITWRNAVCVTWDIRQGKNCLDLPSWIIGPKLLWCDMKISNNMKHYKKRVRRKFWPSKCLNSRHNLWFLLHSNVSKCPLHLLIIHPSSKFLLITYFPGLVHFHTSRSEEWWRTSGILPKKDELESSENHWKITHSQSRFNRIGVEQHEKWQRQRQGSRSKSYCTSQRSERSVIGYEKPFAFDHDRCMTSVDTWMSLIRHFYVLDSKWKHH